MRRVVITGLGAVSCIGHSKHEIVQSLRLGRSGIQLLPERQELGFRSAIGGALESLPPPEIPKKNLRQMGPGSLLGVHAAQRALDDAGLERGHISNDRTAVIIGCKGHFRDTYRQCHAFKDSGLKLGASALQKVMNDSISANLSVLFGTRGMSFTVSAACATGALAVGQAFQLIRWGAQDLSLCGGIQEDTWEYFCQFDALKAFSMRTDEPARASRPFDSERDGLVPSAGGSLLVLEELEHARSRGARIYAELVGYAFTCDGHDMTVPTGEGTVRCIQQALDDGRVTADEVGYINAHATSTRVGDAAEAQAIGRVFGRAPYVSSTKSMTGHEQAAAGSSEVVYTALMMAHSFIAPSINLEHLDPACDGINIVANKSRDVSVDIALSNSFGFGGVNTSIVLKKNIE